jgi:hypothetical protein
MHLAPEQRAHVVRGTDKQVHVVGGEPPSVLRRRDPHRAPAEVVLADGHALRSAGRTRRVRHDRRPPVRDDLRRLDLASLGRSRERGFIVTAGTDDEARHVAHAVERGLEVRGDDDRGRARVGDDPAGLVRLEVDVHGHDDGAETTGAVHGFEELEGVRNHDRDAVAPSHAECSERVRDAPGPIVELAVRAHLIALAERDVIGAGSGVGE